MDPFLLGGIVALVTIVVLFSGVSVATGLLIVSAGFLLVQIVTRHPKHKAWESAVDVYLRNTGPTPALVGIERSSLFSGPGGT